MSVLAKLRSFLTAPVFCRRMERDMVQKWQFHLDARTDDLVAAGIPRAEAEARARGEFGDQVRWKQWGGEARGVQFVDDLRQDAAYAIRQLSSCAVVQRRRGPDARARDRRQHRHLQRRQRRPLSVRLRCSVSLCDPVDSVAFVHLHVHLRYGVGFST
jgi:hypothetical protein